MAKSTTRKITKRLRKGAKRVVGNRMVQDVVEDLVTAALIAAAVKLRDSGTLKRAATGAKAKAAGAAAKAERAIGAKTASKSSAKSGGKSTKSGSKAKKKRKA